jgi:hypothetical protein
MRAFGGQGYRSTRQSNNVDAPEASPVVSSVNPDMRHVSTVGTIILKGDLER